MEKYIILADVTCDLSQEIREYFQIPDYIKGHIHFSDNRDFETTLDWSNISREDFYSALSNKRLDVSTAPASPEEYYLTFKKYVEDGYEQIDAESKVSQNPQCVYLLQNQLHLQCGLRRSKACPGGTAPGRNLLLRFL